MSSPVCWGGINAKGQKGGDNASIPVTNVNPDQLAALDARYARRFTSIPPASWPTTKLILGFALCVHADLFKASSLAAASIIYSLEQTDIYDSLKKLRSELKIPRSKDAHLVGVSFRRDSLIGYLIDPVRSGDFYVDVDEAGDDLVRRLARLYTGGWDTRGALVGVPEKAREKFISTLVVDVRSALIYGVTGELKTRRGRGPFVSQEDRSECLDLLSQVDTVLLCGTMRLELSHFADWLADLWEHFAGELRGRGLVDAVQLKDLNVHHLGKRGEVTFAVSAYKSADGNAPMTQFREWLDSGRHFSPRAKVLVFGSTPEKRSMIFRCERGGQCNYWCMSYTY